MPFSAHPNQLGGTLTIPTRDAEKAREANPFAGVYPSYLTMTAEIETVVGVFV